MKRPTCEKCPKGFNRMAMIYIHGENKSGNNCNVPIGRICINCKRIVLTI